MNVCLILLSTNQIFIRDVYYYVIGILIDFSMNLLNTIAVSLKMSTSQRTPNQGILTYRMYTQIEFKLKFSALLKAYDGKFTENSKK